MYVYISRMRGGRKTAFFRQDKKFYQEFVGHVHKLTLHSHSFNFDIKIKQQSLFYFFLSTFTLTINDHVL